MRRSFHVVCLVLLTLGCGARSYPGKTARLALQSKHAVLATSVRVLPGEAAVSVKQGSNTVFVDLDLSIPLRQLRIEIPEMCPVFIDVGRLKPGETVLHPLLDLLDFGPERAQEGYGQVFKMAIEPGCQKAARGRIEWKVLDGSPSELSIGERGFALSGRLPTMRQALGDTVPWGVVPISQRTRGHVRLHATFRDDQGKVALTRTIAVSAAARSTGIPNVSVGKQIYLGGTGWQVRSRPDGSVSAVISGTPASLFTPDEPGRFVLADLQNRELVLMVGTLDTTPLDCGRTDCHPTIASGISSSAMTTTWKRLLLPGAISQMILDTHGGVAGDGPRCAETCHTVGEPGLEDGGYRYTEAALQDRGILAHNWESLPSPLRRQSGVGCLACHGPSAIPESTSRWSIFRGDVCATCHDAPPTYGHSAAWQSTRMAHSDRDERARSNPSCVRCHTAWASISPRSRPPSQIEAFGIGCATCHDVHPDDGARAGLLRAFPVPALLGGAAATTDPRTLVCLSCHTPTLEETQPPQATAAAIWLGRGGLDPVTGRPLDSTGSHQSIPGGCVGCHAGGSGRGGNHSFAVKSDTCVNCHTKPAARRSLAERARALWAQLVPGTTRSAELMFGPRHAGHRAPGDDRRVDRNTASGRALWNVLLVLEDPAAYQHNGLYAERLLESVERFLASRKEKP